MLYMTEGITLVITPGTSALTQSRWVDEMREIAATFELDGGFSQQESPFRGIAEVYDLIANGTMLGNEKVGQRSRGQTAEDVASLVTEGTRKRKEKSD